MKREIINVSRREFLISTGKLGAGFTLAMYLPGCGDKSPEVPKMDTPTAAAIVTEEVTQAPELGAWVVIQPDDTVIIRIARSEMGQ